MSAPGEPDRPREDRPIRTWEDLDEQVQHDPEYPAELKASFPQAVQVLRREIGELDRKAPRGLDSRYWSLLVNRAPWTRWHLVWLANVIERARSCPGYDGVRSRLATGEATRESIELLETAEPFLDAGLAVEFEPQVEIDGRTRKPDLLVWTARGERLFVEVKHLHDPEAMVESGKTTQRLAMILIRHGIKRGSCLRYAGSWFRAPEGEEEWRELDACVEAAAERASSSMTLATNSLGDLLEFAMAPEAELGQLAEWATARGLKPGDFVGPEFETQEQKRLANTAREASSQLPSHTTGLIVIYDQRHEARGGNDVPVCGQSKLHKRISQHPQLLGVVICSRGFRPRLLDPGDPRFWLWRTLASRQLSPGRCLEYEFVDNLKYRGVVPREILRRLYRAVVERRRYGAARVRGQQTGVQSPFGKTREMPVQCGTAPR